MAREENTWRRVLVEGAVIVTSILLAFAIDAWWNVRQVRLEERALLEELRTTLSEDLKAVSQATETIISVNEGLHSLVLILEAREPIASADPQLQRALQALNRFTFAKVRYAPYETLKDRGLHLVTDETLRKRLTALYEDRFPTVIDNNALDIGLTRDFILPFMLEYFDIDDAGNWLARRDFEDSRSRALTLARHRSYTLERFTLPSYRTTLEEMQATLDAIDAALGASISP